MESYIPEFQDDREKNSEIVISIDGLSGAGKGTLATYISDKLDIPCYSAGDFFRRIAKEKDMTVEELSKKADKETDIKVDRRTLRKGLEESCVVESRISSWVLGDYSNLRIYVTADLEERAKRVLSDLEEGGRVAERKEDSDLKDVKQRIKKRDEDNRKRYKEYYGIDTGNLEIYDLIIDNTDLGIEEQKQLVDKVLREEFPERVEE